MRSCDPLPPAAPLLLRAAHVHTLSHHHALFVGLSSQHPAKAAVQQQSEFAKRASQIGLSIHKTSLKLQKLAQLAKRTSMFDDPSAEIDELTGIIKHDIQALNDSIAELQRVSARRGESNKQSAEHSHTVVDSLRTRLKDATAEFKEVRQSRQSFWIVCIRIGRKAAASAKVQPMPQLQRSAKKELCAPSSSARQAAGEHRGRAMGAAAAKWCGGAARCVPWNHAVGCLRCATARRLNINIGSTYLMGAAS